VRDRRARRCIDDPMDSSHHEPNRRFAPLFPRARKLQDLRKERVDDRQLRSVVGRAAVEVAGELGYMELTVDLIIERAGISRPVFYRLFADRERCYLHGYEELAEALVERLLETCVGEGSWAAGLRSVLNRVGEFMVAEPALAGGLIGQFGAAGADALAIHERLARRLASALARADEEAPGAAPPASAPDFVVAAIESTAIGALGRHKPAEFTERVPDLVALARTIFFNDA
jgi:AcrR family transcriptional regulator